MKTRARADWRGWIAFLSGFALIGFLMADASGLMNVSNATHDAAVAWLLSK